MSAAREPDELRDDARLAEALEALEPLRPAPEFARRMRERFVAGDFDAPPADAAPPQARGPRPLRALPWVLALAAAVVAAFLLREAWTGAPRPTWEVLGGGPPAVVLVDDVEHSTDWETTLGRALARGGRVRTPADAGLRLRLGERLALDVAPASEVLLPAARPDERDATWRVALQVGRLSVVTGPDFAGARLLVAAPDTEVEVVGTRFAVDVGPEGTCVCCEEGRLALRPRARAGEEHLVEAGQAGFVYPDGKLSPMPAVPEHLRDLPALRRAWE